MAKHWDGVRGAEAEARTIDVASFHTRARSFGAGVAPLALIAALTAAMPGGTAFADEDGVSYGGAGTTNNSTAGGTAAIAASSSGGSAASASGTSSIAIGNNAQATQSSTIALGRNAEASGVAG